MRILRIIASIDPKGGGPIEGLKLGAVAMRDMGHKTEVVSMDDPAAPHIGAFPFPVHPCGPRRVTGGFTPKLIPWIKQNANRFDAAVIHGLWNWASVGGWIGLRRAGLPYVLFTHGMMDPWFRDTYPRKHLLKQALWLAAQGRALRDADAVLFTSQEERLSSRGVFFGYDYREKVVAYGVAEPPQQSQLDAKAFHEMVPELGSRPYLLFLSRIHEKKGCDLLVDAFADFASRHPGIDLVMAGPDRTGLRPQLEAMAERAGITRRIHWPGMLEGPAKWAAFRGAEAFVLPSHQENFGIVVAEAMACGTPVLTTNKVNIWREVQESGGGFIEADTAEGVRRLLERWFALSEQDKQSMAVAARKGFEQRFQITAAASDLATVLESIRKTRAPSK